jgi:small-conductance mechanosensitive channel
MSMNRITQFFSQLGQTLSQLNTTENWSQLGLIAVILLCAWTIIRIAGRIMTKRTIGQQTRMRPLAPRPLQRVLIPLFSLLLLAGAYLFFSLTHEPADLLYIANVMLLTLTGLRSLQYWLRKHFTDSATLKAWERFISMVVWIAVIFYLSDLLPALLAFLDSLAIKIGDIRISLLSAINLVLLIAVLFTFAIWLSAFLERRLKEYTHLSSNVRAVLTKVTRYFLIALSIIIALNAVGIDLTALTVFGGALGVGLGFGLQRIASNFISGFLLLFDRSIQPGDLVRIGDRLGQVQELRARYLVVRDYDGVSTLIPNENLITSEVINWSYGDSKIRLKVPVEISYDNDPEKALALLLQIATRHPRILDDPPAMALMLQYAANGIQLEISFWIDDPQNGMGSLRSEINIAIWHEFKANNIKFPSPQHDIHIKELPAGVHLRSNEPG